MLVEDEVLLEDGLFVFVQEVLRELEALGQGDLGEGGLEVAVCLFVDCGLEVVQQGLGVLELTQDSRELC